MSSYTLGGLEAIRRGTEEPNALDVKIADSVWKLGERHEPPIDIISKEVGMYCLIRRDLYLHKELVFSVRERSCDVPTIEWYVDMTEKEKFDLHLLLGYMCIMDS